MKYLLSFVLATLFLASSSLVFSFETLNARNLEKTNFNPNISLILSGAYADFDAHSDGEEEHSYELELPGFQLGGEAGLPSPGLGLGHNELRVSSNIDDQFYGEFTVAIVEEGQETALELENAFIETLSLGNGFKIRAGKFFSGIGYLNDIHGHAHAFNQRPLVYDALLGGHLVDTGAQFTWLAPTPFYLLAGSELLSGNSYPSGENEKGNSGSSVFLKTGADINNDFSWQLGTSYYQAKFDVREAGAHAHGGEEEEEAENIISDGEVDIAGLDFVLKWAPNGNRKQKNATLQAEYFVRNEEGTSTFSEETDTGPESASSDYKGKQKGFYVQGVYQFHQNWNVGYRYEELSADNTLANPTGNLDFDEYAEESSLGTEGDPKQNTLMLSYIPSHFSRIRLQMAELDNGTEEDASRLVTLDFTVSLGAHGAHKY